MKTKDRKAIQYEFEAVAQAVGSVPLENLCPADCPELDEAIEECQEFVDNMRERLESLKEQYKLKYRGGASWLA